MTKIELLQKIKDGIKSLVSMTSEETLASQDLINADGGDVVDGANVTFEDGSEVPDGEYTLADGTIVLVTSGVATIEAPEALAAPAIEADPADPMTDVQDPAAEEAEDLDTENRLQALEDAVSQILDMLSTLTTSNQTMMSKITKLAEAPGAAPVVIGNVEKKANTVGVANVELEMQKIRDRIAQTRK